MKANDNPQDLSNMPGHVERLNSISKLKKEGFEGPDRGLDFSIFEYGIAWRKLKDEEKTNKDSALDEYIFIYGIQLKVNEETKTVDHSKFDRCSIEAKNPELEWDWAFKDNHNFLKTNDLTIEEFRKFPFPRQVNMLYETFGFENIFGSSYWEGFEIKED
jgi:hypothetical protein